MILEALNYVATIPLTAAAQRPFIRYSVNLWSRAARCAAAWGAHEERSKAAMTAAVAGMKQRRTVVVLGSGLLRDVPIAALSQAFDTVVLVDLVHLASVRLWLRLKGYRNVRLIGRDLSGYEDLAASRVPEPLAFLRGVPYLDLVISANLLSQIGTGTKKRLEAGPKDGMPEDTVPQLLAAHIEGLKALPCKTCLVTDVSFQIIDRTGRIHQSEDLLHGVAPPPAAAHWDWPVVPTGEESADYQIVHRVIVAR